MSDYRKMPLIIFLAILADIPNSLCHRVVRDGNTQSLGKSCFPFDSCKTNQTILCRCDNRCSLYGDCCMDSPYRNNQRRERIFSCQKKREFDSYGVYAKSACHGRNVDSRIGQKCEGVSFSNDIELQVPVFSLRSLITYRNYYCALCNNDTNNLTFWDVEFSCSHPTTEKDIMENLVYNRREAIWGFYNERNIWVSCNISPQLSPMISHYRECISTISECHDEWRNDGVRRMCNLYESVLISKDGIIYKNIHCALCNNVNVRDLECHSIFYPSVLQFGDSPVGILSINFKDLIDINLNKGNRIGKMNKCPAGQIYDVADERCVNGFCIFNRILRGGKCVVA